MWLASCRPSTRRLNTSMMNAKYTTPSQQRRYDRSPTHRRLGSSAVKIPLHEVRPPLGASVGLGGAPRLAAALGALDPVRAHQPLYL
jgi:hypothetical protein